MAQPRKIAIVTGSRADFAHLLWPLRRIAEHPDLEPVLIAYGAHFAPAYGNSFRGIEAAGFAIQHRIETPPTADTDVANARSVAASLAGLAEVLGSERPDLMLLVADRYEMLAPAAAGVCLGLPLAHLEGGEVNEGAIDNAIRNALTRLSHLHFAATENAQRRIVAMGEEAWRVHRVGAPALDHLVNGSLPDRRTLAARLGFNPERPVYAVVYHPVSLLDDALAETAALFAALDRLSGQIVFCLPNADTGSRELIAGIEAFCRRHDHAVACGNLSPQHYWGLLSHAHVLIGNSSSGITESPALELPTVNVGMRQRGRERAVNVIDALPQADTILAAIEQAATESFRSSLAGLVNPYGDGKAGQRIANVLASVSLGSDLLIKRERGLRPDTSQFED